jgi:hypothetical protein
MRIALAFALGILATAPAHASDLERASQVAGPGWLHSPRLGALGSSAAERSVTLRFVDVDQCLSSQEFALMADEVTALFRTLGLEVAWNRDDPGIGFDAREGVEVPVVLLRRPPPHQSPGNTLGLVAHVETPPSPIWVFTGNISWALGHTGSAPSDREGRELAVAIGHVVTHELVHALSPRHPHATSGLMGPTLNRQSLLAERATLDKGWIRSLHEGLAALAGSAEDLKVTRGLPPPR